MQWLKVIKYDQWGYITVSLRGYIYKRSSSAYVINRFLQMAKYNQGKAKAYLWKNSNFTYESKSEEV